ncbi:hypothetical protein SESBI_43180 [Sesbania bispinosa]|nr:hypothetical protein SESBI_43180 [Sesbania bispinosa]
MLLADLLHGGAEEMRGQRRRLVGDGGAAKEDTSWETVTLPDKTPRGRRWREGDAQPSRSGGGAHARDGVSDC